MSPKGTTVERQRELEPDPDLRAFVDRVGTCILGVAIRKFNYDLKYAEKNWGLCGPVCSKFSRLYNLSYGVPILRDGPLTTKFLSQRIYLYDDGTNVEDHTALFLNRGNGLVDHIDLTHRPHFVGDVRRLEDAIQVRTYAIDEVDAALATEFCLYPFPEREERLSHPPRTRDEAEECMRAFNGRLVDFVSPEHDRPEWWVRKIIEGIREIEPRWRGEVEFGQHLNELPLYAPSVELNIG